MGKFAEIPGHGILEIDQVIFGHAYPVLFTCFNAWHELFLCLCSQHEETQKKWLVTKTTPQTVVKLLKDEVTIRDAFLENPDCRITVNRINKKTFVHPGSWSSDSRYLPEKGEYLRMVQYKVSDMVMYYQKKARW